MNECSRRQFLARSGALGLAVASTPYLTWSQSSPTAPDQILRYPGPWQFQLPKGQIILVTDEQLDELQDPDKQVDLSLGSPNLTCLRKICEDTRAGGGRTVILAFDEFFSQYRPGQKGKPRKFLPDTDDYIQRIARISTTLKDYGLGLELSLLSPLELGRGYSGATGESGRWVQYREGFRDPATGKFEVSLWEQRFWTNNKGTIELQRTGVRVFAFREERIGGGEYFVVDPKNIVELKGEVRLELGESPRGSTRARRLTALGIGETSVGELDRILVVVSYKTPEMDYFSPKAPAFLQELIGKYKKAGVPLNGLYSDELHIQQDWGYFSHHDAGNFTFRYLTSNFQARFAEKYGSEFADFEKYLVYFSYGQHGFSPNLDARLGTQHVMGADPDAIARTALLRRRYFDLLEQSVVSLFVQAKSFAEKTFGHELEARAHATWAQSPTIDKYSGELPQAPRQYEYTDDFLWSNTVHQAAAACSDYFAWNDFLTGGGNDHAEGGWSDRNYYGVALACSTGILNRVPYAYAAAWGLPGAAGARHQAVCDAFGASPNPWAQNVQDSQHRDIEVLFLYPASLVATEERFGSWMTQYGYANYVTPGKLLEMAAITTEGSLKMAGRTFTTLVVLFEPLPLDGFMPFLRKFAEAGGNLVWSGPPPRMNFSGKGILEEWKALFGVGDLKFHHAGHPLPGRVVTFEGSLREVPAQTILTSLLVDHVYPVEPVGKLEVVARMQENVLGIRRRLGERGSATFLGFRPRDDQAASLGYESRTWFEVLRALGAYPNTRAGGPVDNPTVISRTTGFVACRFPNGAVSLATHYRSHEERWPGGFKRDEKQDEEILKSHPLPPDRIDVRDFDIAGHRLTYQGNLLLTFRVGKGSGLEAFAGRNCKSILIDGKTWEFASNPMPLMSWAPVLPERRVSGGAVLELWLHGAATVSIPWGGRTGRLCFTGGKIGTAGTLIPSEIVNGVLKFQSEAAWGEAHLYLVEPS